MGNPPCGSLRAERSRQPGPRELGSFVMALLSGPVDGFERRFAERLRFPQLFLVIAGLFALDLLIPDLIPYADELFLA
ncbi:MAG: DUF6116 family protein, partial [Gammaproteobacteria bacterium]